ncbi:MAG TPA: ABC transporter permease subunit, partial [Gammaproteobacteria bacterium]|nr:ABC transporter permease subunit [Gammaproteobacteria bacterium]
MLAIFLKELRSLFLSPLAWSLMVALQLVLAWLFLVQLEQYLQIQPKLAGLENAPGVTALVIAPLLDSAAMVIMLLVPLLTMGMFSRESGSGALDLLFSSPVSMTAIVVGKYFAVLTLLAIVITLIALMPLSLLLGTRPDMG